MNNVTRPLIIAINSISGGGKTFVANYLHSITQNSAVLHFDDRDYDAASGISDISQWVEEGADCNKFNLSLLQSDICSLVDKQVKYIFLDYPFGRRQEQIAKYIDYLIYIDTPLDIAMARRFIRDFAQSTALIYLPTAATILKNPAMPFGTDKKQELKNRN